MRRTRIGCGAYALVAVGLLAAGGGLGEPPPPKEETVDARALEVHDGDTLWLEGRELRLLGVDTPERGAPWFEGDQEPWATRAADFVRRQLAAAREVRLRGRGRTDPYGRELVHVFVDGEPLGLLLVREGLAYPTVQRYGDQGFPRIAARLLREAAPPPFPPPWRWRHAHRRR